MKTAREQIQAALETAKKATPGPWKHNGSYITDDNFLPVMELVNDLEEEAENQIFVTTMNPEFAQALLEGWLELEGVAELFLDDDVILWQAVQKLRKALASTRAKLENKK